MLFDPSLSPRVWAADPVFDESEFTTAPHASGQELRRLRYRFNVAAPELAALVGMELESLLRYERGEAVLSEAQMTCLLNTFHELAQMKSADTIASDDTTEEFIARRRERWFDEIDEV